MSPHTEAMPSNLHTEAKLADLRNDAPVRQVRIGPSEVVVERTPEGVIYARSPHPLGPYPEKLTESLDHWAATAPERTFMAKRIAGGEWRRLSYAEAREKARSIGQALVNRGLSVERPIAILSGNDLEHALIGLGAMYAGIPYAPISPAYSLISSDFAKLRHIFQLLTPGLVFAASGVHFQRAIEAVMPPDAELVVTSGLVGQAVSPAIRRNSPGAPPPFQPAHLTPTPFYDLLTATPGASLETAHNKISGDTIAKILFTSGSTGMPKGVINTHRMWSSNQEMARATLQFVADEPPVLVDWLPWNHTFAGNADVGLVLYNGGTLYIDDGKPTPSHFHETVRNLKEIAPTIHLNVPKGFEALAAACAPVIVVADRLPPAYRPGSHVALDVHVVSDLRAPLNHAQVRAELTWPDGGRTWWFEGDVDADSCSRVGRLTTTLPPDARPGPVILELDLEWADGKVTNRYEGVIGRPE